MQIMPGLHSLGNTSGGHVRAYLIDDGNELTLIDTLLNKDGRDILEEIRRLGRQPADVKRIILTHAHQSHLGGLAALKKATGARVYAHDWEADIIAGKRKVEVPPTTGFWPQKPLQVYPLQIAFVLGLGMPAPCEVDETLKDGDLLGPLTVLHTPGHTPGCLAFYWNHKRALIVGDIVVTWPEVALGWPQITLDNKQNRESVGKLCDITKAEVLCVGHGEPVVYAGGRVMRDLFEGRTSHPEFGRVAAATGPA
jgi:glyoxylase-like metal-dependent hydrolase (beta-lactamase superfamily II)